MAQQTNPPPLRAGILYGSQFMNQVLYLQYSSLLTLESSGEQHKSLGPHAQVGEKVSSLWLQPLQPFGV